MADKDKQPLKEKPKKDGKKAPPAKNEVPGPSSKGAESSNTEILTFLKTMNESLLKQGERMKDLGARLDKVESGEYFEYYSNADYYQDDYEDGELPGQFPFGGLDEENNQNSNSKRPLEEPSRFEQMAKKFRTQETVDTDIDPTLANNINELFHNGIDEDRYEDMIKDPKNARPGNCEGLSVIKTNRLIWDAVSHKARLTDRKLQNIEISVVKAATILAKTVNEMAPLELEVQKITPLVDQCNNVLALLGHTNRQVNLTRRDLLRPELSEDYAHLCNHSLPFTTELFGDDVGKQAKEIEDCNKIGNRIQRGGFSGGSYRGRPGFRPRQRGGTRGYPMRGRSYSSPYTTHRPSHAASGTPKKPDEAGAGSPSETLLDQYGGTMRTEDFPRRSQVFDCSTPLADTDMVCETDGDTCAVPSNSAENQENTTSTPFRPKASVSKGSSSNCMSSVRKSFRCQGFSKNATRILMSSWRSGTKKQYQTYISRWFQYCDKLKVNSVSVSIKEVVNFLTEEYERGLGYSALITARGALSSILRVENFPTGSHPVVVRFMKGVFNLRPHKAKYTKTWNVGKVLNYLKSLSPVKHLSLKDLTLKLVMLIALTNTARSQTVHLLNVNTLIKEKSQFILKFDSLLKQSRPGFDCSVLKLKCYPPDRRLCVYTVLKEYLIRTKKVRPSSSKKLLISYIKPHGPVSRDTVSRWIRTCMAKSGIDVTIYGAHSVRSASASKARDNNVPINIIMKHAGWTVDSTFRKYYSLEVEDDSAFPNAVLQ